MYEAQADACTSAIIKFIKRKFNQKSSIKNSKHTTKHNQMKSKVYFIDFKATPTQNMLSKLKMLVKEAGIENIDYNKKMVAIKIHFGEPGNLAYIRPNYTAVIVKMISKLGGKPFLTDTNTLYKGRRSNAIDHLQSAFEHGFNPLSAGCNVIIADGLKGTDYKEIEINQKHCKTVKIGSAIAASDVIISMNHFKGHEMAGFGGALKNIGMGSGSVGGKLEMHNDSKPDIDSETCTGCGVCTENCAHDAIGLNSENIAEINYEACVGCGQCIAVCQYGAAHPNEAGNSLNMQEKIMEYAHAVLKNKPAFHINFIMNISPNCDCWHYNDIPIVPDIGIMASFDPVALDVASAEMVNNAPISPNSAIGEHSHGPNCKHDRFNLVFPRIDWKQGINYAQELGLGQTEYELIKLT